MQEDVAMKGKWIDVSDILNIKEITLKFQSLVTA